MNENKRKSLRVRVDAGVFVREKDKLNITVSEPTT